jgi:hypothetical protein
MALADQFLAGAAALGYPADEAIALLKARRIQKKRE